MGAMPLGRSPAGESQHRLAVLGGLGIGLDLQGHASKAGGSQHRQRRGLLWEGQHGSSHGVDCPGTLFNAAALQLNWTSSAASAARRSTFSDGGLLAIVCILKGSPALVQCAIMLHTAESAAQPERGIAEGDLVVVYEGFDSMKAVRVTARGQFQNKFGCFDHKVIMPQTGGAIRAQDGQGLPWQAQGEGSRGMHRACSRTAAAIMPPTLPAPAARQ